VVASFLATAAAALPGGSGRAGNAPLELAPVVPLAGGRPENLGTAGRQGVIEAVTGTGKTMIGVAAALDELRCREQVVVLVPTVELQQQWVTQLEARLPTSFRVGRMGAGRAIRS